MEEVERRFGCAINFNFQPSLQACVSTDGEAPSTKIEVDFYSVTFSFLCERMKYIHINFEDFMHKAI